MAKYRHRIFEMYDFRDEAIRALTPTADRPVKEAAAPETWTFTHLVVTRSAGATHVQFKTAQSFADEAVSDLRDDFAQLADRLVRDSRVLSDFTGVKSLCAASLDVLVQFKQKLQTKGSRMALCCLEPETREAMFAVDLP